MSPQLPTGPFTLREALIAYGDPVAVRQRRSVELYAGREEVERYSDFRFTPPDEENPHGIRQIDPQVTLAHSRRRLVDPLLEHVRAERIFLRGVPVGMPAGSPNELIPNAWAFELELTIGASSARRLTDRWVNVVATTIRPRADELATSRALVDATRVATVGGIPDGAYVLHVARLRLSAPDLSQEFEYADTELRRFRQLSTGGARASSPVIVRGGDPVGRDLTEHQLITRYSQARAAVMTDFVTRVHDGRVSLTGLQTKPTLASARSHLSPDWAPHMVFDWDRNAVQVFDVVFVDVQGVAQRIAPPKAPRRQAESTRGRGRPPFPFEAFLAIIGSPSWQRAENNTAEAQALLAEYRIRYPKGAVPAHTTIVSHVGKLYEEATRAAAAQKS